MVCIAPKLIFTQLKAQFSCSSRDLGPSVEAGLFNLCPPAIMGRATPSRPTEYKQCLLRIMAVRLRIYQWFFTCQNLPVLCGNFFVTSYTYPTGIKSYWNLTGPHHRKALMR